MLTKSDLGNIKSLIQTETKKIVKNESNKTREELGKKIDHVEKKLSAKIDRVERKLDYSINFLDRDYLKLLDRIERIEKHLHLSSVTS